MSKINSFQRIWYLWFGSFEQYCRAKGFTQRMLKKDPDTARWLFDVKNQMMIVLPVIGLLVFVALNILVIELRGL